MQPGRGPSLQMRLSVHLSGFEASRRLLESVPRQKRWPVLGVAGNYSRIPCNETHGSASVWFREASVGWIRLISYHNKRVKGETKVYRMYKTSDYFHVFLLKQVVRLTPVLHRPSLPDAVVGITQ
jgi:hypothetical protein